MNLFGALRTAMATCGYETVKEFQKAEVMVAPACRPRASSCSARRASAWAIEPPVDAAEAAREGPVLVVDFGAQYAQLIARRVREAHVYSEIVPHSITAAELPARAPGRHHPLGRPESVHETARRSTRRSTTLGIPILGICYGAQLLAQQLGGDGRPHRARRVRPDRADA